eukprot:s405_g18.t1
MQSLGPLASPCRAPAPPFGAPVTPAAAPVAPAAWLSGVAATSATVSTACRVQRQRKLYPGVDHEQDPWREVPWGHLPPLATEHLQRLQQLQRDMEVAYGSHLEPWDVRMAELEEVFRPNRCACTYGELDHFGFARLLQEASLGPGHSFVDVGSGLGKLVVAAACVTPDEVPCYGVEISPFRHQTAQEGLQSLQSMGGITPREAARVQLLLGNCGDDQIGVPSQLLEATHLILTMRRSTKAVNQLCKALQAYGPLPNGGVRLVYSRSAAYGFAMAEAEDDGDEAPAEEWQRLKPQVYEDVQLSYRLVCEGSQDSQVARYGAVERSFCRLDVSGRPSVEFFLGEEIGYPVTGEAHIFEPKASEPMPRWHTEAALLLKRAGAKAELLLEGSPLQVSLVSVQQGLMLLPDGVMFRRLHGAPLLPPMGPGLPRDAAAVKAAWRVWFARNGELVMNTGSDLWEDAAAVQLVIDEDELMIPLEMGLKQLQAGAAGCLRVSEKWGFGALMPAGSPTLRGADVWIELVMHEVSNPPELPSDFADAAERLEFAQRKKEQGNGHLARGEVGDLARAVRRYAEGAAVLAGCDEGQRLRIALQLNGAQAQLRRERFDEAIGLCDLVLAEEPNVKAYYRRAAGKQQLGDLDGAYEDLKVAAQMSEDASVRQQLAKVQVLRQKRKEQERQAYGGVFEKMRQQDEERAKKEKEAEERRAKEAQKEAEERAKEVRELEERMAVEEAAKDKAEAAVDSLMGKSEDRREGDYGPYASQQHAHHAATTTSGGLSGAILSAAEAKNIEFEGFQRRIQSGSNKNQRRWDACWELKGRDGGQPRTLWSVTKHIKMRKGMYFQRRFMIDGFELPQQLGPDDQPRGGKVTQKMVLHEYILDF